MKPRLIVLRGHLTTSLDIGFSILKSEPEADKLFMCSETYHLIDFHTGESLSEEEKKSRLRLEVAELILAKADPVIVVGRFPLQDDIEEFLEFAELHGYLVSSLFSENTEGRLFTTSQQPLIELRL